jgi:hypothetical protein
MPVKSDFFAEEGKIGPRFCRASRHTWPRSIRCHGLPVAFCQRRQPPKAGPDACVYRGVPDSPPLGSLRTTGSARSYSRHHRMCEFVGKKYGSAPALTKDTHMSPRDRIVEAVMARVLQAILPWLVCVEADRGVKRGQ